MAAPSNLYHDLQISAYPVYAHAIQQDMAVQPWPTDQMERFGHHVYDHWASDHNEIHLPPQSFWVDVQAQYMTGCRYRKIIKYSHNKQHKCEADKTTGDHI